MVRGMQNNDNPEIHHYKTLVRPEGDGISDEQWEASAFKYYGNPQCPNGSALKSYRLTELNKNLKRERTLMSHQLFSTICPLCKSKQHTGSCSKNGEKAKELVRLEAVKYNKIWLDKLKKAAEVKREQAKAKSLASQAARTAKTEAEAAGMNANNMQLVGYV